MSFIVVIEVSDMGSSISIILKQRRKELGLSVKSVCDELRAHGVDVSEKTLYGWESGNRQPDADTFVILCGVYGIGSFAEIKSAPSLSDEALRLAKDYDSLDVWGKKQVRSSADVQIARCKDELRRPARPVHLIPFLRSVQPVSAGTGAYLGPEEFETIFVEENDLTRRASFGVTVSGDSMEPLYHDGDVLVVEGAKDIPIGSIGIFTVNGEGYVKERGEGVLISLNPNYAPVQLTEGSWCNGRVIGVLDPAWIAE